MSKGNMLLGHARGKVGSLVFSRANGQQIVRARAEQVKNPQTDAQVIQRIFLNTIAQAYSRMAAIVDHSFEGVKKGQDSMSYFMKKNLDAIRAKVAAAGDLNTQQVYVTPIGESYLATNDYVVSKGSLPVVNPALVQDSGIELLVSTGTYKDLIDIYHLQRGDQMTFCLIQLNEVGATSFVYGRLILDPRNEDGTEAAMTTSLLADGAINKPNPKTEMLGLNLSVAAQTFRIGAPDSTIGGCVIVSRKNADGTWLRSNSSMVLTENNPIGMSVAAALTQFRTGGIDTENPLYLNNGGVGGGTSNSQPTVEYVQISAASANASQGNVSGGGRKVVGGTCTLTATPASGYQFKNWTKGGVAVSTANPYTFTVEEAASIVGNFEPRQEIGD